MCRARAAGTAGTVLAVPFFGRLTISRHGLAIQSGGEWRVVHACSSKRPAAHVSLSIVLELPIPPTPHQLSAGFVFP